MPTSINPFVLFVGPSPGNSPDKGEENRGPYALPTAGSAHPKLYYNDGRGYWDSVRELGTILVKSHASEIREDDAHALIGQINLGTGQFGDARKAPFEPAYAKWVPEAILDHLRPSYVILLAMGSLLTESGSQGFDPSGRLDISWKNPDQTYSFDAYKGKNYRFRIWSRKRSDGKTVRVIL